MTGQTRPAEILFPCNSPRGSYRGEDYIVRSRREYNDFVPSSSAGVSLLSSSGRQPFHIRSPSSKLRLDADSVIDRGLNSLFAAKIAFRGLN